MLGKVKRAGQARAGTAGGVRERRRPLVFLPFIASLGVLFLSLSWVSLAKVFLTQEEALKLAFPSGTSVGRRTAFLSPAEKEKVVALAGGAAPPGLVAYYVGISGGRLLGTAYFDTHVVRTLPETILVLVDPRGAVARIEVLSFLEPEEYLPRPGWYGQFPGKTLTDELSEKRGVRPVTGATLTVRATVEAARRVLALHHILKERGTAP